MDYLFLHRDKRTFTSERQKNLLFRADILCSVYASVGIICSCIFCMQNWSADAGCIIIQKGEKNGRCNNSGTGTALC